VVDWIIGAVMVLALGVLLWMIVTGRPARGDAGGIAALTAFHDFQAKDKQQAVEMIIEQKAGKRLGDQTTGDGEDNEHEQVDH